MKKDRIRNGRGRAGAMIIMAALAMGLVGCGGTDSADKTTGGKSSEQVVGGSADAAGSDSQADGSTEEENDAIEVLNDHEFKYQGFTWSFEGHTLTVSGEGELKDDPYHNVVSNLLDAFGEDTDFLHIEKIVIEPGMTSLPYGVFYGKQWLSEVELPGTLKVIGGSAFANSVITEIVIPEGVEEIKNGAFYGTDTLESVYLPNSVKKIAENAFWSSNKANMIIYGEKGSYGETYANEYGYNFQAIDKAGDTSAAVSTGDVDSTEDTENTEDAENTADTENMEDADSTENTENTEV